MNNFDKDFSSLTDDCLKENVRRSTTFALSTNLSELGGLGVSLLSKSLMQYSMQLPNRRIIELIMLNNEYVFRTPESINNVMKNDSPVFKAFIILGNYDIRCNLSWLICSLYKSGELLPLKDILSRAPPLLIKLIPNNSSTIWPGELIQFEIRTVCKADIIWWMSDNEQNIQLGEPIRVEPCSIQTVTYQTTKSDEGWFYIVVDYLTMYHTKSEKIYVGKTDTEKFTKAIKEINGSDPIKRVALLIGIMKYDSGQNLSAPKYDIAELDPILREIGFTVYSFADLNLKQLKNILDVFSQKYVDSNTYVFFYFAGHGMSKDQKDFVQLSGCHEKLEIIEIMNILYKNKPTVLVSMFDMCRNDATDQSLKKQTLIEAKIPINENVILVMTTFPLEKAYEKKKKYECHSLIIKALCSCLKNNACNMHINTAFANFANDPSITGQRPVIYSGAMPYILGKKDSNVPSFKPSIKWLKERLELYFSFDVFHNILVISLDINTSEYFKSEDFTSADRPGDVKDITLNLLDSKQPFNSDNSITLTCYRGPKTNLTEIPFKLLIDSNFLPFFC